MTALEWDKTSERLYEDGLDRGVLYPSSGPGVCWNGLTAVDENLSETSTPFFLDGLKYLDVPSIEDYEAKLSAITYPDEFLEYDGVMLLDNGAYVDNQGSKQFGLSYRTLVGNDTQKTDFGYKIHLVYNLTAQIDAKSYTTQSSSVALTPMAWTIFAVPEYLPGYRPTAHIIFDTTKLNEFLVAELEKILYGTATDEPRLPSLTEIQEFVIGWDLFKVTDHGDGTWSIEGPDELITMLDFETFQIDEVDVTYLDTNTYTITTTE